jgi:hypothetical protein
MMKCPVCSAETVKLRGKRVRAVIKVSENRKRCLCCGSTIPPKSALDIAFETALRIETPVLDPK